MKHLSHTIRISLPLVAGLAFWSGHAQAAPVGPLALLSAKLQASPMNGSGKYLSTTFAPTPAMSALASTQRRLTGADVMPKHIFIDPLTTIPPAPKNRVPMQLRRMARHLGKDTASPKRLSTQLSITPNWK